jgi:acyl-CoA hydrolase
MLSGLTCYHHATGLNIDNPPTTLVTAAAQNFYFFDKLHLDTDYIINAYLNNVGKTSLSVRIDIYQSNER